MCLLLGVQCSYGMQTAFTLSRRSGVFDGHRHPLFRTYPALTSPCGIPSITLLCILAVQRNISLVSLPAICQCICHHISVIASISLYYHPGRPVEPYYAAASGTSSICCSRMTTPTLERSCSHTFPYVPQYQANNQPRFSRQRIRSL